MLIFKSNKLSLLNKTLHLPVVTNKHIYVNHSTSCVVWGCSVASCVVTVVQLMRLQFLNCIIHF
jgi:hypothetical protein